MKGHAPGEVLEGARLEQAHRRAQHPRHLRVVATGVRGAGLRIGHRVPHHHEAVQLPEERQGGAGPRAPGCVRAHAGQRQPGARREAHALEGLRDELGGLELLESELGMAADRFPQRDDLGAAAVDRRTHPLHQQGLGHVVISSVSARR
jgi:hypothetical protein